MREQFARKLDVRVTGELGAFLTKRPLVDERGITSRTWIRDPGVRPALIGGRPRQEPIAARVEWVDVDQVEVGRHRGYEGALIGAGVGAATTILFRQLAGHSFSDAPRKSPSGFAIGVIGGATALGAMIGWTERRWQTLYQRES